MGQARRHLPVVVDIIFTVKHLKLLKMLVSNRLNMSFTYKILVFCRQILNYAYKTLGVNSNEIY